MRHVATPQHHMVRREVRVVRDVAHSTQVVGSPHFGPSHLGLSHLAPSHSHSTQVVGSAIAFKILFKWPIWVGVLVTGE
jgi:hypothetical protein